jgi:hypothetical protein
MTCSTVEIPHTQTNRIVTHEGFPTAIYKAYILTACICIYSHILLLLLLVLLLLVTVIQLLYCDMDGVTGGGVA